MKASDLVNLWDAPDNTRLTAKQLSFRLPVHVAAKLSALCELYPNKTRTEIVGDLLTTALLELEHALPSYEGGEYDRDPETGESLRELTGPLIQFRNSANKFYQELERELGNDSPRSLWDSQVVPKSE
jgi:hypothetical protein